MLILLYWNKNLACSLATTASHHQLFQASAAKQNCALLAHYVARNQKFWITDPLKMGQMDCPETSVRNGHYSSVNSPEERSFQATLRLMHAQNIELLTWPNIASIKMDARPRPLQIYGLYHF
jgi:hypothetical protein